MAATSSSLKPVSMACEMLSRAACSRPASTSEAISPSKKRSQKRRRSSGFTTRAFTAERNSPDNLASLPRPAGSNASNFSRKRRVSTGASPLLPMATITGERSTMAGMIKRDFSRSSTTFTQILRASALRATQALTDSISVAAITSRAPSRCSGRNSSAICRTSPRASRSCKDGHKCGETKVIAAPALESSTVLRAATSPPPMTTTG